MSTKHFRKHFKVKDKVQKKPQKTNRKKSRGKVEKIKNDAEGKKIKNKRRFMKQI